MKVTNIFFLVHISLLFACTTSNKSDSKFNLDFEKIENGSPIGWITSNYSGSTVFNNDYIFILDSMNVQRGKYSGSIKFTGEYPTYLVSYFILPENYGGKTITLSGYIKTKNVTDGYAGLLISLSPSIAYNDTTVKIDGTTEWKRYKVTMDLQTDITEKIIIGGYLSGKGIMWMDNLKVTIDGKPVQQLKPYEKKILPTEKDRAFDSGSNIVFPELTKSKIDDLELLGRVWGFLKYHHPTVASGNYNWDYELFRMLPDYLNANTNQQRDKILIQWIKKYGSIPNCKTHRATPDSAFIKPDLSWMDNRALNPELTALLQKIQLNRHQGNSYYIRLASQIGNPIFKNERTYEAMKYPDAGFRLLALYRYWNMIQYFYPNKYLTNNDWNQVLKEYIPHFINTKNELEYELIITRLIGEVCDSHAGLWGGGDKIDSLRGNRHALIQVRFVENKWIVSDYDVSSNLSKVGKKKLHIGDIITRIDGKTVEAIVDSIKRYYPASNEAARMRDIANDLLRTNKDTIQMDYTSSGTMNPHKIVVYAGSQVEYYRYRRENITTSYKLINKDIGYITLETINDKDIPVIEKEFMNTKGIIIDIRNYPSAFVPFTLGSFFVSKNTPFVKFTNGNPDNPGEFVFREGGIIPKSKDPYRGKLVVIVNEKTQSLAEYTAMAFRTGNNTTIIGSQTAGADGDVSQIFLPCGLMTYISGIGVYYPDGKETQRVGIVPDIEVKPTIKGIREGRDELLEKAIEIIKCGK